MKIFILNLLIRLIHLFFALIKYSPTLKGKIIDEISRPDSPYWNDLLEEFNQIAHTGKKSDYCLKTGFLPVPVHFYSPIPDIEDLKKRKIWDTKSDLRGVNFKPDSQVDFLMELGGEFSAECGFSPNPTADPTEFFTENDCFSYGCAASLHSMIRHFKPQKIIEVGSGMSSRVISRAICLNEAETRNTSEYIVIDPHPSEIISSGKLQGISEIINERVELCDPTIFNQLQENDILFIDSSHSVKIGSDVNFLILEILPHLAPGVVIHFHDINFPYEVQKTYSVNETFRQFWTEQYLLQSFLCFNDQFEILLSMAYLMSDCMSDFKKAFPLYDPNIYGSCSGSFWMRRKIK